MDDCRARRRRRACSSGVVPGVFLVLDRKVLYIQKSVVRGAVSVYAVMGRL